MTRPTPHAAGFTLLEMIVSLVVVAVLMVGLSSAVVLASRALPHHTADAVAATDAARVLQQLSDELRAATELPTRTATSITFNLPDRDGDGQPQVITYAWSGTPGDPLTRTAHGGSPVAVLDRIDQFTLGYRTTDRVEVFPGATGTSAEVLLSSFDPSDSEDYFKLDDEEEIGFRFTPALPAEAQSWSITRVLLRTDKDGPHDGTAAVRLATLTGRRPGNTLATVEADEKHDLDQNFGWAEIVFPDAAPLAAGDGGTLTLADAGKGKAGRVRWNQTGQPANVHYREEDDEPYDAPSSQGAVDHYLYGTYAYADDDWTLSQTLVTTVTVQLTPTGSTHRLSATVPLTNAPLAADLLLEADFHADPTGLDLDHDGNADWEVLGSVAPDNPAAGVWTANGPLRRTDLGSRLTQPFVLDLLLEDDRDDATAGIIELAFDDRGSTSAQLQLRINRLGDTQQVQLLGEDPDGVALLLHSTEAEAGRAVAVRLVVDPARDTVAIITDDDPPSSYRYPRSPDNVTGELSIFPAQTGSTLRLDHVRLAVAGSVTLTPSAYGASDP